MMEKPIKFKDLSTWLKIAIVYAFISLSCTIAWILLYAIIGLASLD